MSVTFFLSVLACRKCPERQCSEQQCAPAFSGMVGPWVSSIGSVHRVSPGRSWSVPGRSWSVYDVSPQFQSWVRHLRHAGMPLKYLWARSPCRRPVRSPPSSRGDGSEVPVGRDAVPKTRQKNALPRGDATEVPVGKVAVPKGALAELIEL